jgi:tetratricopeptide (TPR) repeat protein
LLCSIVGNKKGLPGWQAFDSFISYIKIKTKSCHARGLRDGGDECFDYVSCRLWHKCNRAVLIYPNHSTKKLSFYICNQSKLILGHRQFFILLLIMLCACEGKDARLQKFLLKGNLASHERNWSQAMYYYGEAIRLEPCFADAWNNLGTVYFEQQNYEKALESYDKSINCSPKFIDALLNRANTCYELKEYFRSISDLERAISIKPDTSVTYFTLGLTYTKMREFNKALNAFDKASQYTLPSQKEQRQELSVNHAIVQYYLKNFEAAKTELQQASKLNDREPNIYNTLALIEIELGHYAEAMNFINEAIRLDPKQSYYVNNRGYIFLLQDAMASAEADINNSISKDPNNAWAYRNKGIYYLKRNDFASAERLLKQSLNMDPFVDKIYFYLGQAYLKNGKNELACESFKKSNEQNDKMVTAELLKMCK